MVKSWEIIENSEEELLKIRELQEKYGLNELLATILVNRNIVTE